MSGPGKAKILPASKVLTGEFDECSPLFKKLLVESAIEPDALKSEEPYQIAPKPGFCLKTWTTDGEKVFVNVCTSDLILKPKDLNEDEVRRIVESEDPTQFRVPMGIGEVHKEQDKDGKDADAYDIVIHNEFFKKVKKSAFFKEFFITLVLDGLESKYDLKLSRDFRVLKNRKAMGTLRTQSVRSKSKPVIMEMDEHMYKLEKEHLESRPIKPAVKQVLSSAESYVEPSYTVTKEPDTGSVEFLVVEIEMPKQPSAADILLDVGEDCLILYANSGLYKLDISLPVSVNNELTGAQFNRKTKKLTVTLPALSNT